MKRFWAAAAWLSMCTALPALACPLLESSSQRVLQKGAVQVVWKPDPTAIPVGKHFALDVQICPAEAVLTRVDATMPEHQHGMNYRPSFKRLGNATDGRWRAEGLLFHMPGRWDLRFDVQLAEGIEKITDTVILP